MRQKKLWLAYLLWFFGGFLGIHKFYLEKIGMGIIYILTGGLFFFGWFIDLFTLPSQVDRYNLRMQNLFYRSNQNQDAEQEILKHVLRKTKGIEKRLQNVEDIVTSKEYDFDRRLYGE